MGSQVLHGGAVILQTPSFQNKFEGVCLHSYTHRTVTLYCRASKLLLGRASGPALPAFDGE